MVVNLSVAGSVAVLLIYGAVVWVFIVRYLRRRRPPSLAIAFVSTGWMVVALLRLSFVSLSAIDGLCWAGAAFGAGLLVLVTRADRVDPTDPPG